MNLTRSFGSVGGLTLASRILALVRDSLQARYVGANFADKHFKPIGKWENLRPLPGHSFTFVGTNVAYQPEEIFFK